MTNAIEGLQVVVAGLGVMGRGIARVFDEAGAHVIVADMSPEHTAAGLERLTAEANADGQPLRTLRGGDLDTALAGADLLVEAVPEQPEVKRALLEAVAARAKPELVVASNTSSLSISELAVTYGRPEQFLGLHFFNPPTRMRLVEVIAGARTEPDVLGRADGWVRALGKTPVRCIDSPNFIVNRICRPLYLEAQLLLTQGAEAATVDTIARHALGHPVGPIELLDAIGLHSHLGSSETAFREFGDPRYRPIPVTRRLVRAGQVGRANGQGFYDYSGETPRQARQRVLRPTPSAPEEPVVITGPGAAALAPVSREARVSFQAAPTGPTERIVVYVPSDPVDDDVARVRDLTAGGAHVVVNSSSGRWLDDLPPGAGWIRVHPANGAPFAEVVDDPVAGIAVTPAVMAVLGCLAATSVAVPALPGLIADRLRATLLNEAALVVEEGVASPEDIDLALRLGMNHPAGPFEQLAAETATRVVDVLRNLMTEFGDPRYRPTMLLRRWAAGASRGRRPALSANGVASR